MDQALQNLIDKQEITEVLWRYCRGIDRMDRELTLSCWHEGGTDHHGILFDGTAEGFVDWVWPVHADMLATRHMVSNILIEVNGDKAASECYWHLVLRIPRDDGVYDLTGEGRYIDTFEKIDGVWAIRHRTSVGDIVSVAKQTLDMATMSPPLLMPNNPESSEAPSARDKTDFSYTVFASLTQ
ncbi:MAG: nuclear transport factor 2 family protein [Pseudomonadota bacterium]